jgi:hypothetical protein
MTYAKFGTEFGDDCAEANLSDAAFRTHMEAISYIYGQENFDCTVKKSTRHRWAGSERAEHAVAELIAKGMWKDGQTEWTVVHHGDVIRQSLAAQLKKREYDKRYQRGKRGAVVNDVGNDDGTTQTDRQTDKQPRREELSEQRINGACEHELKSWNERQRGMCNRCYVTATAQLKTSSS